ncbi:hypothetical protein [Ventosimonas gracilis]|nr:hypothetical protein [Ventosimonas gracilis]
MFGSVHKFPIPQVARQSIALYCSRLPALTAPKISTAYAEFAATA